MTERISAILITGLPGVGKTTAVKKLSAELSNKVVLSGFYTEEVRDSSNCRVGFDVVTFDVVTFDEKRDILARSSDSLVQNIKRPKVGKYSVHTDEFEKICLPALSQKSDIIIIDEIGKMELLSRKFEQKMEQILPEVRNGRLNIVATIPSRQNFRLIEELKAIENVKLFELSKQNRNDMYKEIRNGCFLMLGLQDKR